MTINQMIGMSHGKQEPMESGRYHNIIHRDIIHHDVIHFAFTKMADSQNYRQKYTRLLPSICTFFGLIFQKPLTCIRNNIVLHVYFNLKCHEIGEKQRIMLAQTQYSVLSAMLRVCVCGWVGGCGVCDIRLPNLASFDPVNDNERGRH